MPTLQEIKKENGLTNMDIARALHCSTSKAGMILQGRYIHTYTDEELAQLAQALSNYYTVTFERCWMAMCESYNELAHTPGKEHQRPDEVRAQVKKPREMTTIETVLAVPEERRLGYVTD